MIVANILEDEIFNMIEVESIDSFTPPFGTLEVVPDGVWIGFVKYDGVWKLKKEVAIQQTNTNRKALLEYSDIVMLPDNYAKLNDEQKTDWANYRQALRDITEQSGYPWDIQWPAKPNYDPIAKKIEE
jgi:hypothetical protein